jgi:hypothetical protein
MDKYICLDLLKYVICHYLPHTIHSYDGCISYPVNKYTTFINTIDTKSIFTDGINVFHDNNIVNNIIVKYNYVSNIKLVVLTPIDKIYSNIFDGTLIKHIREVNADKKISITLDNPNTAQTYINTKIYSNNILKSETTTGNNLDYFKEWYLNGTLKYYKLHNTTMYGFFEDGRLKFISTKINSIRHYTYYQYHNNNFQICMCKFQEDLIDDDDDIVVHFETYVYKNNKYLYSKSGNMMNKIVLSENDQDYYNHIQCYYAEDLNFN